MHTNDCLSPRQSTTHRYQRCGPPTSAHKKTTRDKRHRAKAYGLGHGMRIECDVHRAQLIDVIRFDLNALRPVHRQPTLIVLILLAINRILSCLLQAQM